MDLWVAVIAAYVVGSLDFAVVVSRAHGVDITEVGSGNPGTSNVLRTLGRGPAAMVLVGDALKGVIAAAMGWMVTGGNPALEPTGYLTLFLAVLGHCFPIFHRFRGGKGVATAAGGLAFLVPQVAFPLAAVWAVLVKVTKVASIGSLTIVVLTFPLVFWAGARGMALAWLGAMLVLIAVRHAPNIRRMLGGSEQKVST